MVIHRSLKFMKKGFVVFKANGMSKALNWMINRQEFKKKAIALYSYPVYVDIEITNRCLLRCIHCARTYLDVNKIDMKLGSMSIEKFLEILDKLRPVHHIVLQGMGEPLLNPDIFKMIELAHKQNFQVSFSTAASVYNSEIEEGLRKYPPDLLTFSVDSMEKASFEETRVNHNFERFTGNVEKMITAVRKADRFTNIQFNCCVMRANSSYFVKVVEFAGKLKVRMVNFTELNFSYLGMIKDKLILTLEDYANVEKAMKLAREKGIVSVFTRVHKIKTPGEVLCRYLWKDPFITWDGYVTMCCGRPFGSVYNLGNIFEVNSFMEIWNSPKMQVLRQSIRTENVPAICFSCPLAK
jgi:MoaA/NifB/PqqE/SkfB family radical SAM enzyme